MESQRAATTGAALVVVVAGDGTVRAVADIHAKLDDGLLDTFLAPVSSPGLSVAAKGLFHLTDDVTASTKRIS